MEFYCDLGKQFWTLLSTRYCREFCSFPPQNLQLHAGTLVNTKLSLLLIKIREICYETGSALFVSRASERNTRNDITIFSITPPPPPWSLPNYTSNAIVDDSWKDVSRERPDDLHGDTSIRAQFDAQFTSSTSLGFCGLVVRVPGYRSKGPGSIPGATTSSEK
jgi:hypothetical protein